MTGGEDHHEVMKKKAYYTKYPGAPYGFRFDPLPKFLKKSYYVSPSMWVSTAMGLTGKFFLLLISRALFE